MHCGPEHLQAELGDPIRGPVLQLHCPSLSLWWRTKPSACLTRKFSGSYLGMTLGCPAGGEGQAVYRVSAPRASKQGMREQPWDASPMDAQRMEHEPVRDS